MDNAEMKHYEALANAIIVQAVVDYREVYKLLKKRPEDIMAQAEYNKIRRFFQSRWFRALTSVDADYLIRMVEKEIDEGKAQKKGIWKSKGMLYGYGNH